ncbi:unnamed protein product [Cylicocyclus nassatus]|uniref:Uncharacterized protein n=1 Tax=Cylicocyclus nassatus TaxID=53992 RepID=A0AA36GJ91_CYLNA|nr:unnamed protein product [Cylicocyclus nassatus]
MWFELLTVVSLIFLAFGQQDLSMGPPNNYGMGMQGAGLPAAMRTQNVGLPTGYKMVQGVVGPATTGTQNVGLPNFYGTGTQIYGRKVNRKRWPFIGPKVNETPYNFKSGSRRWLATNLYNGD